MEISKDGVESERASGRPERAARPLNPRSAARYFFITNSPLAAALLSFNYDPTKASFVCGMNCYDEGRTGVQNNLI